MATTDFFEELRRTYTVQFNFVDAVGHLSLTDIGQRNALENIQTVLNAANTVQGQSRFHLLTDFALQQAEQLETWNNIPGKSEVASGYAICMANFLMLLDLYLDKVADEW